MFAVLACGSPKEVADDTGGCPTPMYADADGDGYGAGPALTECDAAGATAEGGDCDDAAPSVHPGATEAWYDGVDADCSGGSDFDQDGDGDDAVEGGGGDCDDTDVAVSSLATEEWYDGVDQDCSGGSDFDQDGDGDDAVEGGGGDCDDTNPEVSSMVEESWYDGIDQDCSGGSDFDQDGDGEDASTYAGADCDDTDAAVHPGATELACNGADDNCDGAVDEATIAIQSDREWRTSEVADEGWQLPGFDDSAWSASVAPAPEDCGWTYTTANLGRDYRAWEHAGTPTMWAATNGSKIYLRRTFDLPAGGVVTMAMITSIVDDAHDLYLNGVRIGGAGELVIVESDMTAALQVGENVLALEAVDYGGCRWAVVDATVSCAE